VQRDIYAVQKEYAFSGEEALGDILISLMVDRMQEDAPSLRELILVEALGIAPKIPTGVASALTISYLLQADPLHFRPNVTRLSGIELRAGRVTDLIGVLEPFVEEAAWDIAAKRHMGFIGCLGDDIPKPRNQDLGNFLGFNFPGIFTRG